MGGYFKPWRRKVGLVTLVMACVFAVGWVRSNTEVFWFGVKFFPTSWSWYFISGSGQFLMTIGTMRRHRISPTARELTIAYREIHDDMPDWIEERRWPELFFNSEVASTVRVFRDLSVTGVDYNEQAMAPYWSIVVPLTLISAFLLLSKPCKSTQMKLAEPVPSEGK